MMRSIKKWISREIGQSLDMGWDILSTLPKSELTRVSMSEIRAHIKSTE